jgi:putative glycosyltransferase (TIGR04372 family)
MLVSSRIGHFAANVELYLCEIESGINRPKQRYFDFHYVGEKAICNFQLLKMWKRRLHIGPSWFFTLLTPVNRLIPGGKKTEISHNTSSDRDVHNLLDRTAPHLSFTKEEIDIGERTLEEYGLPLNAKIVCIIVRDNAYLSSLSNRDWTYHDYRNCTIQNFEYAANELTKLGYYVFRMGVKVELALKTTNPKIFDYAINGMRSDFMDIYLGYKCTFCISTATGWDAVANVLFRKPTVFVNNLPLGIIGTFSERNLIISKHAWLKSENRELSASEIFDRGVGYSLKSSEFISQGIELIENSPEEIYDLVLEMHQRLTKTWVESQDSLDRQNKFWKIFKEKAIPTDKSKPYHGMLNAKFGSEFLRKNSWWIH